MGFGKWWEHKYIQFWKINGIWKVLGLTIYAEYKYEYQRSISTIWILFTNRSSDTSLRLAGIKWLMMIDDDDDIVDNDNIVDKL